MPTEPAHDFVTAQDGLKLHVSEYGTRAGRKLPVVCLPGLTRTAEDFDTVAQALCADRRILALDYRGRGRSEFDRNPKNYSLPIELADVLSVLAALEASPAVFLGSSRGGLITMLMAAQHPSVIAGAILNDIGPVIEQRGLMRIKSYVGRMPTPHTYEEGAEILRRLFDQQFPTLGAEAWLASAKRTWRPRKKRMVLNYDPKLSTTLKGVGPETQIPALWPQFDALAKIPVMVIRGTNSDLLSAETVAAMQLRRDDLDVVEVPDQGHTPLLADDETIGRIAAFVARCDAQREAGNAAAPVAAAI